MHSRRSFTKKYYHKLKINYQHIKNNKKSILANFGIKNFISTAICYELSAFEINRHE